LETQGSGATVSADEFQALEQKVLRAVEVVRREREARAAAEAEVAELRERLEALTTASNAAQTQITTLNQERETVRARVEKMLQQMDELV
jgi:chromosome segregation ATPase